MAEGIQLIGAGNHVLRNQIIGTTVRGVEVRAGGHVIKDNLIADGADDGIALLVAANGNEIRGNTIYGHVQSGLFVGLGTVNNTLERNQVLLNGVDLTDANPGCDANVWQDNVFETSQSRTTASTDPPADCRRERLRARRGGRALVASLGSAAARGAWPMRARQRRGARLESGSWLQERSGYPHAPWDRQVSWATC